MSAQRYAVQGGEYMPIDDAGRIARTGSHTQGFKVAFSDSWRIVGAVERNNFGAAVRFYSVAEILSDPSGIPWKFKNGKQRTFIQDYDHGARREWRNPSHHVS